MGMVSTSSRQSLFVNIITEEGREATNIHKFTKRPLAVAAVVACHSCPRNIPTPFNIPAPRNITTPFNIPAPRNIPVNNIIYCYFALLYTNSKYILNFYIFSDLKLSEKKVYLFGRYELRSAELIAIYCYFVFYILHFCQIRNKMKRKHIWQIVELCGAHVVISYFCVLHFSDSKLN